MNPQLFNVNQEERDNILNKHKTLYDGYAVRYNQEPAKEQPLYVQDFANDKEGITVNSNGEVSSYNNKIYMKESKNVCNECGLYEEVCECSKNYMDEDIHDVEDINPKNKFDYTQEEESEYLESDEVTEDFKEKLKESLDMFSRFRKYN